LVRPLDVDIDDALSVEVTRDPLPHTHALVAVVEHLLRPWHSLLGNHHAANLKIVSVALPFPLLQGLEVDVRQLANRAVSADVERQGELG
jgi:hypothetical protein